MTFWNDSKLNPTRQFRFMVSNGTNWWWVSSCSKPSYQISTEEYKLINHKFKYPGVVTWNDVELSIVDTGKTAKVFYNALVYGGYGIDNQRIIDGINKNFLKESLNTIEEGTSNSLGDKIGNFKIQQLDDKGIAVETWTLINPFIKSTNFGQLDYASDELVKLELVISYDYATLE